MNGKWEDEAKGLEQVGEERIRKGGKEAKWMAKVKVEMSGGGGGERVDCNLCACPPYAETKWDEVDEVGGGRGARGRGRRGGGRGRRGRRERDRDLAVWRGVV
jgi:hypothetical protein